MSIEGVVKEFFEGEGYRVSKVDSSIEGDLILRMTKDNEEYMGRYFGGTASNEDIQRLIDDLRQSESKGVVFAFDGFASSAKELIKKYGLKSYTKEDMTPSQIKEINLLVGFHNSHLYIFI